ncbi:FctA domain-containing protein [uncultured Parolsenella sp.]|uniref:Spy0128 family protein n=1 Tax=uncultured Parolsenella sp. TaxID=2083008 RepID=UPI00265A295E|nr:FctA domain-containing protein [uncultured Parolsenella sp.]
MERRKTRRWGGVLACALTTALALVLGVALPATQAYATDVSLDEPDHAKTVTDNGDGTYKLSLTVKGDSQSSSESTPADVVLAIDTSGSMNDNGKLDNVKRAAKALIDELLTDDNAKLDASKQIQVSVISFDTRADTPTSFTANAGDATQAIDGLKAGGGTNWEEALQKANAQNSGRTDARKYIVFFSDGAPTYRISSVQTGTKLGFSFSEGFHKVPAYDEDDTWATPHGIHGSGNDDPYNANYNSAVTEANKRDVDTVQLFAVSGDTSANASMTKFANDVTGDFLDGTDADKLNDAFAEIAQTITNSCYYRDVKIVDQLSDYVDFKDAVSADGTLASATITKTDASGTSPVAGAVAKVDGKKLTVDLSGERELEADATYTVSFDIRPTADAYDAIAAGTLTNPVPTNVNRDHDATTLEYKTVTKRTGATDVVSDTLYADYDIPTIALPTKQLTVTKTWENARDDARATQPVHVQVTRNSADYGTPVELSASNNWTSTVTVTGNPADASAWGARETDGDLSSYTTNVAVDGLNLSVTNTHKAWPVTVDGTTQLAGTKTLTGRALVAGEFSFTITPCGVAPAPTQMTAENDAAGNFHFGDITFDAPGTYYYNVAEVTDGLADKGITAQTSTLQVEIDVVEKDGALVAQVSLPDGGLKFENAYKPSNVTVSVTASKHLVSNQDGVTAPSLNAGDFNFTITGDGPLPATTTVSNGAAGNVSFGDIKFTKDDLAGEMSKTFTYTITESGSKAGVNNDSDKRFTVTVTDNGDGTMSAKTSKIAPFVNTYSANSVSYSVSNDVKVSKKLSGRDLKDDDFTFELVDEAGNQVATATNQGGTVTFPSVDYTKPGEYKYTVREVNDAKGGVTYDASTYQVTVTVKDNGEGRLEANATSISDAITFKNSYAAAPTSVELKATKAYEGATLAEGQFTFEVVNNGNVVARGTNDANGNVSFGSLALTRAGTYDFTIREVNDGQANVTYDDKTYDVKVTVADDGVGQLTVSSVEGDNPTFTNTYTESAKAEESDMPAEDKQIPQTGDTNSATVPVVLAVVAVVCVAAGLVVAKRRK